MGWRNGDSNDDAGIESGVEGGGAESGTSRQVDVADVAQVGSSTAGVSEGDLAHYREEQETQTRRWDEDDRRTQQKAAVRAIGGLTRSLAAVMVGNAALLVTQGLRRSLTGLAPCGLSGNVVGGEIEKQASR